MWSLTLHRNYIATLNVSCCQYFIFMIVNSIHGSVGQNYSIYVRELSGSSKEMIEGYPLHTPSLPPPPLAEPGSSLAEPCMVYLFIFRMIHASNTI